MAEVKWIKITTDMFDNRKIKHLRKLPDGNNCVLIWVMLLTMAGRCNANGMIFLTETFPYSPKMLADELDFEENTVKMALQSFELMGMIERKGDFISIKGWEEYQNAERLAEIKEYNRLAQPRSREKKKLLQVGTSDVSMTCQENVNDNVNDMSMTCQSCQDIDIDIDKDIDIEIDKESKKTSISSIINNYTSDADMKEAIKSFIDMRKTLKKPMTEKALQMMLTKLDGLASIKKDKIDIINQSVLNSWQSVYPLKEDQKMQKAQRQEHDYSGVQRIDPRQQFKGGR